METVPSTCVVSSRYHVENCNFSPDGRLLSACFGDFTVRLLRIGEQTVNDQTLRDDHAHPSPASIHIDLYWVIKEHKNSVWCARFSPDGLLLCTCSSDKTAKIWNVNSRTLERSFDFHTDTVWSCCFFVPANSSTKSIVATGSSDQTVKVWRTESGEVLHDLGGYGDAIDSLDFSSSGELLCTSCRDGVVKIWMNLSIKRAQNVSLECNTDCSMSVEPICLDLTAVNRSASRFCTFSTFFSSYVKNCDPTTCTSTNNEAAATDEDKGEILSDTDAMDLFPKSDPNELLFAGGPENSFAVWSLRDIAIAFKNLQTEEDIELTQTYQDITKESSHNTDEHPNCLSQSEEENEDVHNIIVDNHETDDHSELNDLDSKQEHTLVDQQMMNPAGTQLGIIEEEEEGTQVDLTERTDQEDSNSEMTETSQDVSSVNGESSYVSEESFSFYKMEPRWTLTDHLSTVWDCCTATLHSSNHNVISEEEFNDVQVLITCSGDRTLRFWKFENSIDPASPPVLNCVKVFQMPDEHSESQILTCASCSTNQLLALGLFNGSLHLANLSDLCSALYGSCQ